MAGAGGTAGRTTATANGITAATADASKYGGQGAGLDTTYDPAAVSAGAGGSANLADAVAGTTEHGSLSLTQEAWGGAGGDVQGSDQGIHNGGNGGDAASWLNVDDAKNPVATQSASIDVLGFANGGRGGMGSSVGGVGGAAKSFVTLTAASSSDATARAYAVGGDGGAIPTFTGEAAAAGGTARAGTVVTGGDTVHAVATAYGGAGGNANGSGRIGGAGGVAHAGAFGALGHTVSVEDDAYGGGGGSGSYGAHGGAGADETLINTVHGWTAGGSLTLTQNAYGGYGGSSDTGTSGAGGSATSSLTFDDIANPAQSASLSGAVTATGGGSITNYGPGGSGGDARATIAMTGAGSVSSSAISIGGSSYGFRSTPLVVGRSAGGGRATAIATGTGTAVDVNAQATGGTGQTAGIAHATATGNGVSGSVTASAHDLAPGRGLYQSSHSLLPQIQAAATAPVDGTSTAVAEAQYSKFTPSFVTSGAAVAIGVAAPPLAQAAPVLSANPAIGAAFGAAPTLMAFGELGGGHSSAAGGAQTATSSMTIDINPAHLVSPGDLTIGFYGGAAVGTAGLTGLTLTVSGNGTTLFDQSINSGDIVQQADSLFSDQVFDLGAFATSGTLDLTATLAAQSDHVGAGFYGYFVTGAATGGTGAPSALAAAHQPVAPA
ncbi:MAG TPA: hypothetical protein VME92_10485 [Acetobacteraceae bacterium]|nr:hypothetical protein [Acetobacteraceae bacterium]